MKRLLLLTFVTIAAFSAIYAGENENDITVEADNTSTKVENRTVSKFTKIAVDGCVTVYYTQGSKHSVKVKGPAEALKELTVKVKDNTLLVSSKNSSARIIALKGKNLINSFLGNNRKDNGVYVYITSPNLIGVMVLGSGNFICSGLLDTDNMYIELKGSGDINFKNIICDDITTKLIGSGDINIKNLDALYSKVNLVGSGDIGISQKNTKHTNVSLKGSGDISISFNKCNRLESNLKGSGDITFRGKVASMKKEQLGSGDYHIKNLHVGK
ncbi:MAG: DUF2807 domain-containing protein [Prevotella sp.]|nr:DUF2807 domain-containing protein [Prevotella sp.]